MDDPRGIGADTVRADDIGSCTRDYDWHYGHTESRVACISVARSSREPGVPVSHWVYSPFHLQKTDTCPRIMHRLF